MQSCFPTLAASQKARIGEGGASGFVLGLHKKQPQIPFGYAQGRLSTSVAQATSAQDDK
jgi:hypothetical protein